METKPSISIIFPAKNEGDNVKKTLGSLYASRTNYPFEVIVINDGSTDHCCDFLKKNQHKKLTLVETKGIGAANARNLGALKAKGEYLIFCDAHLQFENWWIDRLIEPLLKKQTDAVTPAIASLDTSDFIGYGQSLNPNMKIKWNQKQPRLFETAILPGGCFAISKKVFDQVGGFETGFKTWGYEDIELSMKLWLFGYRCHCQPRVTVHHLFRKSHPYEVNYEDYFYNLILMAYSHFNNKRIQKCKKLIVHGAKEIETEVIRNGAYEQRKAYFKKRKYSDEWYFKKFGIRF